MKALKAAAGISIILGLSACDEENIIQEEIKKKIHELQNETVEEKFVGKIANGPTRADLYGFWVSVDSYIVISNGNDKFQLTQLNKNVSKSTKYFMNTAQEGNKIYATFINEENLGENFSFEFNDRKDTLTMTTDEGEKIYKYTEITPEAYINNFD
ncbi:hypothetical protein [Neobacillus mesonae]|uniref:hypothetical protein n=1 Tax=Neobacillus mesonae TaxID=1193713 RepID=UPI00083703ED|nr:hypothetical protein [Neobacillus mesonae]